MAFRSSDLYYIFGKRRYYWVHRHSRRVPVVSSCTLCEQDFPAVRCNMFKTGSRPVHNAEHQAGVQRRGSGVLHCQTHKEHETANTYQPNTTNQQLVVLRACIDSTEK